MEKKVSVCYEVVYGVSCLDRSFMSFNEARLYATPRRLGSETFYPAAIYRLQKELLHKFSKK